MKRVLIVPTTPLGHNGITNVICNQLSHMDKEKFQLDFVISTRATNEMKEFIKKSGGKIYELTSRNKKTFSYIKNLKKIVLNYEYKIVHVHGNSGTMLIDLIAAKAAKASIRIAHGHSSTNKHKLIHK